MSVALNQTPGILSRRRLWGFLQGLLTLALTLFGLLVITFFPLGNVASGSGVTNCGRPRE